MRREKQRISKIARDFLVNDKDYNWASTIDFGDQALLGAIFKKAGMKVKVPHPLNRCKAVIDALDKESKQDSALFEKGYIMYTRLNRIFTLIEKRG